MYRGGVIYCLSLFFVPEAKKEKKKEGGRNWYSHYANPQSVYKVMDICSIRDTFTNNTEHLCRSYFGRCSLLYIDTRHWSIGPHTHA